MPGLARDNGFAWIRISTCRTCSMLRSPRRSAGASRLGHTDIAVATEVMADLADLGALRWDHEPLLPRVWELREILTPYDAVYVVSPRCWRLRWSPATLGSSAPQD